MSDDEAPIDDVASEAPDDTSPQRPSFFSRRASSKQLDPEIQDRLRTLDPLERKWGFGAAGLLLAISTFLIPPLLHNTHETVTATALKGGGCPKGFHHLSAKDPTCVQVITHHPSEFVLKFVLLVGLGLLLMYFVWQAKRTLAIFTSFFAGLAAGTFGLLLIFYGAWLLMRSWRLQRYGATDNATVRKVAADRAVARREAKKTGPVTPSPTGKTAPPPSKRYTPKSKPRRK